ncbi:MAG TPA: CYTH domain-containing protein [Solirubrobacterales bacterium]
MATEIERKFLLDEAPPWSEGSESIQIEQGYLAIDGETEVRVRRADREALLTVKGGHGEVRDEVEIQLDEGQFEALWRLTEGRRLRKAKHLIPLDGGLEVELDVFEDSLGGLLVAEIEFADGVQSHGFEPPDWLGEGDQRRRALRRAEPGGERRSRGVGGRMKGSS